MNIYDTLTKEKKPLEAKDKELRLFVCGPTVYDDPHIGHARTYMFFDSFVKYLRQKGVNVVYLQNITDVDDKIIKRAQEENISTKNLANKFEQEYYSDMEALGITSVTSYEKATNHISEIISQVERLLEKDYAYEIPGDGIYFDISKYKEYGKLSGRTALQAEDATSRIDESIKKRNRGDFALWKFSSSEDGPKEPQWDSPWGKGRPGWHIEDTAITEKHFGPQYDIHGGGRDLIFPHHEAEIAQMEAVSGKIPFVEYWMHPGFLTINGEKMAKSLKNFITIKDALKTCSPQTLRLFFSTKHYRSPIDYNEPGIKEAAANEKRISEFWGKLISGELINKNSEQNLEIEKHINSFWLSLEDDFSTPKAFAELFELITLVYKKGVSEKDSESIISFLENMNKIFNITDEDSLSGTFSIPPDIIKLVDEREEARRKNDWAKADELRDKLAEIGYTVEDTDEGPRIKRL